MLLRQGWGHRAGGGDREKLQAKEFLIRQSSCTGRSCSPTAAQGISALGRCSGHSWTRLKVALLQLGFREGPRPVLWSWHTVRLGGDGASWCWCSAMPDVTIPWDGFPAHLLGRGTSAAVDPA